jgi:hypothetical protein
MRRNRRSDSADRWTGTFGKDGDEQEKKNEMEWNE